jgi:hypothetical protein
MVSSSMIHTNRRTTQSQRRGGSSFIQLASPFLFPAVLVAGLVLAVNNTSGAYVDFQSSFRTFRAAQSLARVPLVSRVC